MDWGVYSTREEWINTIETSYKLYQKVWKDLTHAKKMIRYYGDVYEQIKTEIRQSFSTGNRYTWSNAKVILMEIYKQHDIKRVPKIEDLTDALFIEKKKVMGERMIDVVGKKLSEISEYNY
jgi:hypothetical protein